MTSVRLESRTRCNRIVDGKIEWCPGRRVCYLDRFQGDVLGTRPRIGVPYEVTVRSWLSRYPELLEVTGKNKRVLKIQCRRPLLFDPEMVVGYAEFIFSVDPPALVRRNGDGLAFSMVINE